MPDSADLVSQSHIALEERIRQRAHEIWLSHKDERRETALDDWLAAEAEVLGKSWQPAQDRGTTVGNARTPDPDGIEEIGEA